MATRKRGETRRPFARAGTFVRQLRLAKQLKQKDVAKKAGFSIARVSDVERGYNVEILQYDRIAKALNYKDFLEMFRAHADPYTRQFFRLWSALDDVGRRHLLERAKAMIVASEE